MPVDAIAPAPRPARARKAKALANPPIEPTPEPEPVPTPTAADYRESALLLKMAADPTRLHILDLLADGPLNVGEICEKINMSQPAISHHIAILRHSRLVSPTRSGKNNYYNLLNVGRKLALLARPLVRDGSAR
jgi:DNA-binding transcriptional ArsR family regulator